MTIFYVDYENGNDLNGGTSFDVFLSGFNGNIPGNVGSTGIFNCATANFPNDGSLIGQHIRYTILGNPYRNVITGWISPTSLSIATIGTSGDVVQPGSTFSFTIGGRVKSLTPLSNKVVLAGDEIRMIASPDPVNLGVNGTWTSGVTEASRTVTVQDTTPITCNLTAHGFTTGDTINIAGATGNTSCNATWEITVVNSSSFTLNNSISSGGAFGGTISANKRNTHLVRLSSPLTQTIASTGSRLAWTPSTFVQSALSSTSAKEGAYSDQITIDTTFTTGKIAYYTLPSALDLSAYTQISFWIATSLAYTANALELRLCSDISGDVAVNTFALPANPSTLLTPFVIDNNAPLGSSVQSIALYGVQDLSTTAQVVLHISNIIACNAGSLNLQSLVGKNIVGETWWAIQSIDGTRLILDNHVSRISPSNLLRGYYGASETVTLWKREATKIGPLTAGFVNTPFQVSSLIVSNASNPIQISGGWNRTDMSTQNGETWYDGLNSNNSAFYSSNVYRVLDVSGLAFTRVINAFAGSPLDFCNLDIIAFNNSTGDISTNTLRYGNITLGHSAANSVYGISPNIMFGRYFVKYGIISNSSNAIGGSTSVTSYRPRTVIGLNSNTVIANNTSAILAYAPVLYIQNFTINQRFHYADSLNAPGSDVFFKDCLFDELANFSFQSSNIGTHLYSQNHNKIQGNVLIRGYGFLITTDTSVRKTESGFSWKFKTTTEGLTSGTTPRSPMRLKIAKIAVLANSTITVKAWMRRSNTGFNMKLYCASHQLAGMPVDISSSMTAAADTWEEVSLSFTPTETGVVEIEAQAYGSTAYDGWVDDVTVIRS
jgi:hypothetical protein